MTSPIDEAIRLTVDYITNRAQHYFSIVRSKPEEGVLWFSFVYQHEQLSDLLARKKYCTADEAARAGLIGVKRTAFLPMSAIQSTDAKPLLEMTARCDRRQQFVAWFTLEMADGGGQAQVSKVIVVDTLFASVPSSSNHHGAGAISQSRFSAGRKATPNRSRPSQQQQQQQQQSASSQYRDRSESAIDDLRRDMQETAAELRHSQAVQGSGHGTMATLGGGTMPTPRSGRAESPSRQHSSFFGGGRGDDSPEISGINNNNNTSMNTASDANYAHLLKVSLQISDSVAKLSQRVDGMFGQFSKFEQHIQKEMYDLRMKVQRVDSDVADFRPKMANVLESTAGFNTRMGHTRQEMQAMFESVSKKVAALSDSVISRNLQQGSSFGNNNNNNGSFASPPAATGPSAAAAAQSANASYNTAMSQADKVNIDDLISRHSMQEYHSQARAASAGGGGGAGARSSSGGGRNVRFVDGSPAHATNNSTTGGRRQDALDRLLNDNDAIQNSYDSRRKAVAMREMNGAAAQGVVDEYNVVAKDLKEISVDHDEPISVSSLNRQKANLELARQSAANRSEAQAIASDYMHARDKALGASTLDVKGGVPAQGVPVALEVSSGSVGAGPVVVSESHQGPTFGGGRSGSGSGGSLSDLISNMERKLGGEQ